MLTKRQLTILKLIIQQPGISGKELSNLLMVTSRTIRSEIAVINNEAKVVLISAHPKQGYLINNQFIDIANEFINCHVSFLDENETRFYKILGHILFSDECYLYELSDVLSLSESFVRKEVLSVIDNLKLKFGCSVFKLYKDQCIVTVSERDIRKILFQILKNEMANFEKLIQILNIFTDNNLTVVEFNRFKDFIKTVFLTESIELKDNDLILLCSCIEIIKVRNLFGYNINNSYECEDLKFNLIFNKLCSDILYLNLNDVYELYQLFYTFKFNSHDKLSIYTDFTKLVFNEFCDEIFDKYSLDLKESSELAHNILLHLEYMLRRVSGGYELKNPIIHDIKQKYKYSFEISMLMVPIVFKYKQIYITEDEISYLAVYIEHFLENINHKIKTLIVTKQRHSITNRVLLWLDRHFENQIQVMEIINSYQLVNFNLDNYDFIVFLNDFIHLPKIETYYMVGLPDIRDLEKITKIVHNVKLNKRVSKILQEYVCKEAVHIYQNVNSLDNLLFELVHNLYNRKIIDNEEEFYLDILQREKNYPTNVGAKMMLPHALFSFASKNGIEIALLKDPILHNGNYVNIVVILAFEKGFNENVELLLSFLNQIAFSCGYLEKLISSNSVDEFIYNLHCFNLLD